MNFEFFIFFSIIFPHKNLKKLIILEVARPREYDRTVSRIGMILPGSRGVRFHGLGSDF